MVNTIITKINLAKFSIPVRSKLRVFIRKSYDALIGGYIFMLEMIIIKIHGQF